MNTERRSKTLHPPPPRSRGRDDLTPEVAAISESAERRGHSAPANRVEERKMRQDVWTEENALPPAAKETTPSPASELQQCTVNGRTPANTRMPEQAEASSERPASSEEDHVSQTALDERQGTTGSDDFELVVASASFSEGCVDRLSQEAVKHIYSK